MKICKHCKSKHHNTNIIDGEIKDICFNCEVTEDIFLATVKALNMRIPINGRPRILTVIKYKIEKI